MPKGDFTHAWVALRSYAIYRCDAINQYSSFQDARLDYAKIKKLKYFALPHEKVQQFKRLAFFKE